jgi:hypothetical protein
LSHSFLISFEIFFFPFFKLLLDLPIMVGKGMSQQRFQSSQCTDILAPISIVWEHLAAFDEWQQWNPSVRLPADFVLGQWCKAKVASHTNHKRNTSRGGAAPEKATSGKKRWVSTNCSVDEVISHNEYTITWTTQSGFLKNTTCMKLTSADGTRKTTLTHSQTITGPPFTLRGSPRQLLTNSACINQCFKNHVECLHFQSLLMDASNRNMSIPSTRSTTTTYKTIHHSSTSLTGHEDMEEETVDSGGFWTSSAQVRNAVVSQLVDELCPSTTDERLATQQILENPRM